VKFAPRPLSRTNLSGDFTAAELAKIESSPVWGIPAWCCTNVYDLISKQFLCWEFPKPVKIHFLPPLIALATDGQNEFNFRQGNQ